MENKMEEELLKEEKEKNKIGIYIVGGILLLLIIGIIIFRFLTNDKNNDDNNIIDNSTLSDDVTKSDDVIKEDTNINKNGNELYIYQKGYSGMAPIAFTYECKSDTCNLYTTNKGFVLFDEDKVLYREMTQYEYEQINNSDVSPNGEELDGDGFSLVDYFRNFIYLENYYDDVNSNHYIYNLDDEYFFLTKLNNGSNNFYNFDSYCNKLSKTSDCLYEEKILFYKENIYDLKNNKIIDDFENYEYFLYKDEAKKNGSFYQVKYSNDAMLSNYVIYNSNFERIYNGAHFYINDDYIYYIENNKIVVKTNDNMIVDYDNFDNLSLMIENEMLLYLDKDSKLCVKNLKTGTDVYNSEIVVEKNDVFLFLKGEDNNFYISYVDYDVFDDNAFRDYVNKFEDGIYSDVFDYSVDELKNNYYVGYKIILNEKGEYLSKEYNIDIYV